MNVDYKILKSCIIKSCNQLGEGSIEFAIDYNKLKNLTKDLGVTPIMLNNYMSDKISSTDVSLISEYFKGNKLSWFDKDKRFLLVQFVITENIDNICKEKMDILKGTKDGDRVEALAKIIADYPCYQAMIVSFMSNEPKRFGKPSYVIKCRANTVIIKSDSYKYNNEDIV